MLQRKAWMLTKLYTKMEAKDEWNADVKSDGGILIGSYNSKPAIDLLSRIFTDLFQLSSTAASLIDEGMSRTEARAEMERLENIRDKEVAKCVSHAQNLLRRQLNSILSDFLYTFVSDAIVLRTIGELNSQTPLGTVRLQRKKGARINNDGSLAAAKELASQRFATLLKDYMDSPARGQHGVRDYSNKKIFVTDLRDAISSLLKRGKVTRTKVADELIINARTLSRRLKDFGVDFKAEVERQKVDTKSR